MGMVEPALAEAMARHEVGERFHLQPGNVVTSAQRDAIRDVYRPLALWLMENLPASRERSLAITELEASMMWSLATVDRHTVQEPLPNGRRDGA